jgi:hypothetical protein
MFGTIGIICWSAIVLMVVAGILISYYFKKKEEYDDYLERKTKAEESTSRSKQGYKGSGEKERLRS